MGDVAILLLVPGAPLVVFFVYAGIKVTRRGLRSDLSENSASDHGSKSTAPKAGGDLYNGL